MKLAPHLHRLGNDIVASYLVDTDEGITLVDAGLPGHWRDLHQRARGDRKVAAATSGASSSRTATATTSASPSGFGVSTACPSTCTPPTPTRTQTGEKPKTPMGPMRLAPTFGFFAYGLRKNAFRTTYVQEVVHVHDGQVLDLRVRR